MSSGKYTQGLVIVILLVLVILAINQVDHSAPYLLGEYTRRQKSLLGGVKEPAIQGQNSAMMEPSVEWHLAQYDMTVQLESGVREALANRVTNHQKKKENGKKMQVHLVCSGRSSLSLNGSHASTAAGCNPDQQSEEEGWC